MKTPTVVNKYKEDYDIYIGRGSYWGNPFPVSEYGRDDCLDLYENHLRKLYKEDKETFLKELKVLEGKTLGCFCKPQRCHGDFIVEVFDKIFNRGGSTCTHT